MRASFNIGSEPKPESSPASASPSAPAKSRNKSGLWILIVIVILLLIGGLAYMGKLYMDTQNRLKSLQQSSASKVNDLTESEVNTLIAQVAKHIALPADKPQIVTITNVDQLKINQPFFAVAQNGDKLLVYTSKVILYRTSIDKIIDIAQIRNPTSASVSSTLSTPKITPTPTVKFIPTVTETPIPAP
jgi:hypothetical protein